jgi:hypothetical protein
MNLRHRAGRLKPRQQEHQAHLRGLPAPPPAGRGESPQGDLVPSVAANSFAGSAEQSGSWAGSRSTGGATRCQGQTLPVSELDAYFSGVMITA